MKKKGFTLIELIVVLAILAIIMAIAVPTAFGSIERTKDKAAAASVRNIASMVDLARGLAYTDTEIQGLLSKHQHAILYYKDGKYYSSGGVTDLYEEYFVKSLEKSGIQLEKNAFFAISVSENTKASLYDVIVLYSNEGYIELGIVPKPNYPYYMYENSTGAVTKHKSATESEVIME